MINNFTLNKVILSYLGNEYPSNKSPHSSPYQLTEMGVLQ